MNMESKNDGPDLNLAPPPGLAARHGGRSGRSGFFGFLLVVLIVLQIVVLIFVMRDPDRSVNGIRADSPKESPEVLKALAMRLEDMGVSEEAAVGWERFLATGSGGSDAERALIRYRAGKLYQEAGRHGDALAAFIRAEKEGLQDEATKLALGPRVIDCLRALGHYGAISSELHRRVGSGKEKDESPVVASFAGETLTRAQFDRILEKEIDSSMEAYRDRMDPETLKKQRDSFVKMYRSPEQAREFLESIVMKQVMIRRARELKLDQEDAFKARLLEVEGLLLAKEFQDREVTARLKPTGSDIQGYYEIHKEDYKTKEKAKLRVLQVASKEAGEKLLPALKDEKAFIDAVKKSSLHEETKEKGGLVETPLVKGERWQGFGWSAELEEAVFSGKTGAILERPFEVGEKFFLVRVEEKIPEAVQPLEAVQQRVVQDYMQNKRTELLGALKKELGERYRVRYDLDGLKRDENTPEKKEKP